MKIEDNAYLPFFLTETLYAATNKATDVAKPEPETSEVEEVVEEAPVPSTAAETVPAVEAPAVEAPAVAEPTPAQFTYLGENQRKIALLAHYPQETHLPEEHQDFLGKILQAVQLGWTDVALINLAHVPHDHPKLVGGGWLQVIGFGVNHPWLAKLSLYHPLIKGPKAMLATEDLGTIAADANRKRQLWQALQQIFTPSA